MEDCPAAHEGGLKGSGGTGRVLYPSQCIYSYSCPCLWCHLPLQSSMSSGKMKGGEVNVLGELCTFSAQAFTHICDCRTPRQPPLTFWIYSDGAAHVEKTLTASFQSCIEELGIQGRISGIISGVLRKPPLMICAHPPCFVEPPLPPCLGGATQNSG